MSASLSQNPFEAARARLLDRLSLIVVPKAYRVFPSPGEHLSVAQHIRDVAEILDDWLAAIGDEVADNAVTNIDRRAFDHAFLGAVDGNATFEAERCAEALLEGREAA